MPLDPPAAAAPTPPTAPAAPAPGSLPSQLRIVRPAQAIQVPIGNRNREAAIKALESIPNDAATEPVLDNAAPTAEAPAEGTEGEAPPIASEATSTDASAAGAAAAPDPKAEILAARARAKEAADSFAQTRAKLAADWQRKQEEQRARAELEQQRQAHAQDLELAKLAREQPFEYLRRVGKSAEELVAEGLKQGDPNTKLAAQLADLQRRVDESERQREELQAQLARGGQEQRIRQYEAQFTALVEQHPQAFPTLVDYEPAYVHFRAQQIAQQYARETGEMAPVDKVLSYLDTQLQQERQARRGGARAAGMKPGEASGANGNGAQVDTLTSAHAPGPTRSPAAMTPEERRNHAKALIAQMRRDTE